MNLETLQSKITTWSEIRFTLFIQLKTEAGLHVQAVNLVWDQLVMCSLLQTVITADELMETSDVQIKSQLLQLFSRMLQFYCEAPELFCGRRHVNKWPLFSCRFIQCLLLFFFPLYSICLYFVANSSLLVYLNHLLLIVQHSVLFCDNNNMLIIKVYYHYLY